jgi:hypothetical protein
MKKILLLLYFMQSSLMSITQTMDWVSLPQTLNGRVTKLCVYNNELIVGGFYTQAGQTQTNKIAAN